MSERLTDYEVAVIDAEGGEVSERVLHHLRRVSGLETENAALRTRVEQAEAERDVLRAEAGRLREAASSRPMGNNRKIIVSLLESAGEPMAVRDVANKAYQNGQIRSAKGYRGVYSIVQTVLGRNKRTTFIKVAPGKWGLRAPRGGETR